MLDLFINFIKIKLHVPELWNTRKKNLKMYHQVTANPAVSSPLLLDEVLKCFSSNNLASVLLSVSGLRFLISSCFHILVQSGRTARLTDSSDCSSVSSGMVGSSAGTNTASMSSTILKRLAHLHGTHHRLPNQQHFGQPNNRLDQLHTLNRLLSS